jgi:hypothetical protein
MGGSLGSIKNKLYYIKNRKRKEIKPFNRRILSSSSSVVNVSTNIIHFITYLQNVFQIKPGLNNDT